MTPDDDAGQSERSDAEMILVQLGENAAVLFGTSRPDWLDVSPFLGATDRDRARLVSAASVALGAANAVTQAAPAVMAAQGIVELSPQTIAALETLSPMVGANGMNLGALVDGAGKIGHVVQWAPAGAAAGLSFAASMGTSIALIAIQLQLREISRSVQHNIQLTQDILDELRWTSEAEIVALDAAVRKAVREARAVGAVTPAIFGEIQGKEHLFTRSRDLLLRRVSSYADEIERSASAEARRKWVTARGDRCHADLRSLMQIHQDWFAYQAIRSAYVAETDSSDRGADLVDRIREDAQQENESVGTQIVDSAERIQRQLGLLEDAHASRVGRFRSADQARKRAGAIRQLIDEILPVLARDLTLLEPILSVGDLDMVSSAVRLLSWVIGEQGPVLVAAQCRTEDFQSVILVVTKDHIVVTPMKKLIKNHLIEHRLPTSQIRYVVGDPGARKVMIATPQGFFNLTFAAEDKVAIPYITQLLKSMMQLPSTEIPPPPTVADLQEQIESVDPIEADDAGRPS